MVKSLTWKASDYWFIEWLIVCIHCRSDVATVTVYGVRGEVIRSLIQYTGCPIGKWAASGQLYVYTTIANTRLTLQLYKEGPILITRTAWESVSFYLNLSYLFLPDFCLCSLRTKHLTIFVNLYSSFFSPCSVCTCLAPRILLRRALLLGIICIFERFLSHWNHTFVSWTPWVSHQSRFLLAFPNYLPGHPILPRFLFQSELLQLHFGCKWPPLLSLHVL